MRRIALVLAIGFLVFWAGARFLAVADAIRGYSWVFWWLGWIFFVFWSFARVRTPRTPDGPGRVTR